jgi:hypothetical protein
MAILHSFLRKLKVDNEFVPIQLDEDIASLWSSPAPCARRTEGYIKPVSKGCVRRDRWVKAKMICVPRIANHVAHDRFTYVFKKYA